jgi:prepilin-type N-terminal cleavage/methylation domain-containing protein/prepilin-type processing-associated H-X9-DG protein
VALTRVRLGCYAPAKAVLTKRLWMNHRTRQYDACSYGFSAYLPCEGKKIALRRSAFTLIELLVVIAIISLLVSILLPSLTKAKDMAKSAICGTRLRQLGVGAQFYLDRSDGTYPRFHHSPKVVGDPYWQLSLLWALGEATSEQVWSYDESRMNANREIFHCPSDPNDDFETPGNFYLHSYGGNMHLSAVSVNDVPEPSRVYLLLDIDFFWGRHSLNVWMIPELSELLGWRHPQDEGFNVVFCDGHVENQREYLREEQFLPQSNNP